MKIVLRVLAIVAVTTMVSCSPKLLPQAPSVKEYDLPNDTACFDSLLPIKVSQVDSKPITGNIFTFCDSVNAGLISFPLLIQSEKPNDNGGKQNIIYMNIDSSGNTTIYASNAAYIDTIKTLREVISKNHVKETTIVKVVRRWYDDFFRYGFFVVLFLFIAVLAFILYALKSK